jgi:truncated hemoglobin YjbI
MASVFEQTGGLYERLLADPVVAPYLSVTGVTHDAFDRVVAHLVDTLASDGAPVEHIEAIGAELAPLRARLVTVEEERRAA